MRTFIKYVRDVIYGFIELDEQEIAVINHPAFQRLRRIRQLALTEMVYPGANHTRFEHSLGVMKMASLMFDSIISKKNSILTDVLRINDGWVPRCRKILRLAALLHDIGHPPFSHAGEGLMPIIPSTHARYVEGLEKRYEHEEYSIEIIKQYFRDIIENHPLGQGFALRSEEITALLGDSSVKPTKHILLWKEMISGQLDADRADYLLRDSHHLGVSYGIYDKDRLISCMTIAKDENEDLKIAIEEGGWHIAESLVIARYQMFSQIYFHKTRRIFDYHISNATKCMLQAFGYKDGCYPPPTVDQLKDYIEFDDWKMFGALKEGKGGEHGEIVINRRQYKSIYETQEIPTDDDQKYLESLQTQHADKQTYLDNKASTNWYKLDKDVWIYSKDNGRILPLSFKSRIIASMQNKPQYSRLYIQRS